ncbi:hypothetical protein BO70DRAFT_363965 [Aspergillus heteromorphus CBS 117.55]|uniref:DUF7703 domain-containing protein n=1 Tax=Aspergillus heteromorphus CBS 117.55 TaxID=1448321 RepID=A0A317VP61_9EURO|nr:uncharacterized protein BO70DRAFT_363965 [Aspergillus heteromorphus CBS 117.55]PWY75399.1 hypothetical protein BO70DRAFT_363965 [Aspergillus heteromorphus CBS 117.55]
MPHFTLDNTSANNPTGLTRHLDTTVEEYVFPILIALAWCNAIELVILCLNTFKRYEGSYFWSLLIASFSIIPFGLGYMLKMFGVTFTHYFLEIIIVDIGWTGMVTGQSIVLWSRLHLVFHHKRILRALLYLIIVDAVLLHTSSTALELAVNARPGSDAINLAFGVIERIQLVWFCVQELLLSGLYIRETVRMLRMDSGGLSRSVLTQLLLVNIAIILLDLSVVAIQYAGYFTFQVTFKALVYSIKLKLEYVILGRLVDVAYIRTQAETPRFRF